MDNMILEFLEAYKSLDELCQQILSSDRGISEYIDEMDIRHFVDKMNELYLEEKKETNLKIRRNELGVSQSKLAELTGIPVRTIQQYEQKQKNINKAQAAYLVVLARVLCCGVDDLIEKV